MSTFGFPPVPTLALAGLLAVAPGVAAADPASPPEGGLRAGDWLVRGRIIGTTPTEQSSRIRPIGGRVDTPAAILPDLDVSYFLTDHVAIEAQAGAARSRPVLRDTRFGDLAIGSVWNAAAMAIVQYHFRPSARFNPYLGVGVAVTTPLAIERAENISPFKLEAQVSPVLQAGFDHHLTGNWFANAMVKYIFVPRQSYKIGGVTVEADMNTLVAGAGIGYRF